MSRGDFDTGPVPRIGLSREEAAASLGMSVDSFERYVQPHVRMLWFGRMRIVPVSELQSFCERQAKRGA